MSGRPDFIVKSALRILDRVNEVPFTPGHVGAVKAVGVRWAFKCSCRLTGEAVDTEQEAIAAHLSHRAIIARGNATAARNRSEYLAETRRRRTHALTLQASESLALAQQHITRCGVCGSQVWDGDCGTCNRLARRLARKKVAA